MVDLCNSTKGICLTGTFIALTTTTMLPSRIKNYSVFKELEVGDYVKELFYLLRMYISIMLLI